MRMTKDEILLIVILLMAFVVGAAGQWYRQRESTGASGIEVLPQHQPTDRQPWKIQ